MHLMRNQNENRVNNAMQFLLVQRILAGHGVVEEVTSQQNHVHILGHRQFQDLLEGRETVLAAHRVFFAIAQVVVGSHQDANHVVRILLCCRGAIHG